MVGASVGAEVTTVVSGASVSATDGMSARIDSGPAQLARRRHKVDRVKGFSKKAFVMVIFFPGP